MRLQCMIFGLLFLGTGIFFFIGKAIPLLRGWQILSEEERASINAEWLGRNAGIVFISAGVIFELSAWSTGFREKAFVWSMIAWLVLTGTDVYLMEKTKRYLIKKGDKEEGGTV